MTTLFLSHVGLAYLSLGLLLIRGLLCARQINWRQYTLLKITPHLVDTLLLGTGIIFIVMWGYPIQLWLIAKFLLIVLYIIFAAKAFKKSQPFSIKHFLLAVVSFICAMLVAIFH
ncbi:putative membrane protein SirB2 [Nicoletella semolina]|uniref:Putative membrane protein SirB2 n=1 Tax=Nicoletella semolina TaxID=271160 RepID=A0A4R2NAU5_9PAST|nr:SirB2 family protein [Nicoletella semolina]MDH2924017.1 invasion protein expression up-regulator SirB [Nicoletella semolina]TCP18150.1 putative membrane protein SirB2 [Nicoletella semolina]